MLSPCRGMLPANKQVDLNEENMINPHHPPPCHWHPCPEQMTAVPEPSTWLIVGAVFVFWFLWSQRKNWGGR